MLHLLVFGLTDLTTVQYLSILEPERVSIEDTLPSFLGHDCCLILSDIDILVKLGICEEVLPIDSVVGGLAHREGPHIELVLGGSDTTSESWLLIIQWQECDPSVCVSPEPTK